MSGSSDRQTAALTLARNPIREAYAHLSERVAAALSRPGGPTGPPQRVEVEAPDVEPLAWLAAQAGRPRLYWADRGRHRVVAAAGIAERLDLQATMAPAQLLTAAAGRLVDAAPGIRYYGGCRFDTEATISRRWQAFGRGWLMLPRVEWIQEGEQRLLACNVLPGRDGVQSVLAELDRLAHVPVALAPPGPPRWREDTPTRADWLALVERISTAARRRGEPAKVVLARRTSFTFDTDVEGLALLQAYQRATESNCFLFFFDPGDGTAFMGASPERLFHRRDRHICSEALAGTRPRGATVHEDTLLREQLLACAKEGREHACVVRHIENGLAELTDSLDRDRDISVVELAHVQHLNVHMRGYLRPGVTDGALLAALHPTPAVAGDPPAAALARIGELEPFDRGWYAGPVGYVGADDTQFAVAIRSGLVRGHHLDLYVGAGILAGSRPAGEWLELESKMNGMQSAWHHD
ncbi:MAG: isochorismate synthase [Gammaproteobacteria bacterium]|nr:isochorismate synthase [Gammaproteobacteria bacterium]